MAKKKEKVESFDFEKAYNDLVTQAYASGLKDDMTFNTLLNEFKRVKNVCDELYTKISEVGVAYKETGSKGQVTFKSNPLTKDYLSANKTLVVICGELKEYIAKIGVESDWL